MTNNKTHSELPAIIGRNLRRAMKREGWQTIAGLARACNVTPSAMSNYVLGNRKPIRAIALKICEVLGITLNELYNDEQHDENGSRDN